VETIRRLDERFLATLDDILSWANQLGVANYTRFHKYRDNIEWLRGHDKPEDRAQLLAQLESDGRLTEILSTMSESIELVETIPSLRQNQVDIPREILRRAFSGPVDASLEDHTSNEARNAMFELTMGAMAAREGLQPKLSVGNPDVSFEFENHCIKMECKRVLSETKIDERIKEGAKQLGKSVQPDTTDVGLVAISLSKLLNPGDRILVSEDPHAAISQQTDTALRANENRLGMMRRPSIAGILFFMSTAVYVPGRGYSSQNSGTVFPLNLKEQLFLRRLAHSLRV
jgi:hypothetical protein